MRHLTRLYFENTAASDKYVAFIDQGIDTSGHPRFNFNVDFLKTASEMATAAVYLTRAAAFFKLPVGATAIVDVYIPDAAGSRDPKLFDYQVFKSKVTLTEEPNKDLGAFLTEMSKVAADKFPESQPAEAGPAGPNAPVGATGGSGSTSFSTCTLYSPSGSSCGGEIEIPCADPLNTVAACSNGSLNCIVPEPPGPKKQP